VGYDFYDYLGNPQLKPEINNEADIIVKYSHEKAGSAEINLFGAYVQDFIYGKIVPPSEQLPLTQFVKGVKRFENGADAILISTIISHNDVHRKNMRKLDELCREKGIRDKVMIMCGGTQVTREIARECGMDDGFGRGTKGIHVVNSMVKILKDKKRI